MKFILVLPALKASGGVIQALAFAQELAAHGAHVDVRTMWRLDPAQVETALPVQSFVAWQPRRHLALLQLPWAVWQAWRASRGAGRRGDYWIFTHFASFAFDWCVPTSRRLFFIQDLEWTFVGPGWVRRWLRAFILARLKHGRRIAANDYLRDELLALGLGPVDVFPIWADAAFAQVPMAERDVDVVMVLRKGAHKRIDLYLEALQALRDLRLAVITPDDELAAAVALPAGCTWVRPSVGQMATLYARSRVFLMLSEHEGFGLPPLEAMAAGCVPVCRDSGGVRAYMQRSASLSALVLPRAMPLPDVLKSVRSLLQDPAAWATASADSRHVFRQGVDVSRTTRGALARRLLADTGNGRDHEH